MTTTPDIQPLIDEQVNRALAKLNFYEFCLYYDPEFFTAREFLKEVADALQWVYDEYAQGRARKVGISMPPRAGKSYTVSCFCAWWLGKFPELSIMRNTCTAALYDKFSYDVRNIVKSEKYQNVFPEVRLAPDKQNINGWNTTKAKQVSYFGAGVGGTIIGFGANIAVSDDLYKDMEDALSPKVQEGVSMWKQSAHNSRMEKNCPEVFVGTRWTKNDEIGKVTEKGKLDKALSIPAMVVGDDGKLRSFCEAVKSTKEYEDIKADTEESIWEAEYMQNPVELKGLLFPKSELRYFKPSDLEKAEAEFKYMSVDPADKRDDTAAPNCELYGKGIYVTQALCNNNGTDVTIPDLIERIISNRLDEVEIEGVGAWILFGKEVRTKVTERYEECSIRIITAVTGNKEVRIKHWSAFIKNHFYFLHEDYWTPDYRKFMKQLTEYMRDVTNQNDGPPDSLALAAKYFQRNFSHLW